MADWGFNEQKQMEFTGGKENWKKAAQIAAQCKKFILDDEDELVSEMDRSCYNCRFRRWTVSSFVCMKMLHNVGES